MIKINMGAYASYYMVKFSLDNEKEVIEFLNKHHLNSDNVDHFILKNNDNSDFWHEHEVAYVNVENRLNDGFCGPQFIRDDKVDYLYFVDCVLPTGETLQTNVKLMSEADYKSLELEAKCR